MNAREKYTIAYRAVRMRYSCGYDGYYWLQTGIASMDRYLAAAYDAYAMDWVSCRDRIEDTREHWRYLAQHIIGNRQFSRTQKSEAIKSIQDYYRAATRFASIDWSK